MKVQYVAYDGRAFDSELECREHERAIGCNLFADPRMNDKSKLIIFDKGEITEWNEWDALPTEDFWSVWKYVSAFWCGDPQLMNDICNAAKSSYGFISSGASLKNKTGLWKYDSFDQEWRNMEQEMEDLNKFFAERRLLP